MTRQSNDDANTKLRVKTLLYRANQITVLVSPQKFTIKLG